jgi:hypothetical protein
MLPPAKLMFWDDLHVSIYGPSDVQNYRVARRRVEALMSNFCKVIRECMKDQAREFPGLKRFRVRVQS